MRRLRLGGYPTNRRLGRCIQGLWPGLAVVRGLIRGAFQPGRAKATSNESGQVHGISLHWRQGSGAVEHDHELAVASEAGTALLAKARIRCDAGSCCDNITLEPLPSFMWV